MKNQKRILFIQWNGAATYSPNMKRYISEEVFKKPVIIYNYPEEIKPFYMKGNEDGKTVRAMDVLLPKLGEIIGGSQREDDYKRFDEIGWKLKI